jgi:hypothetical protein
MRQKIVRANSSPVLAADGLHTWPSDDKKDLEGSTNQFKFGAATACLGFILLTDKLLGRSRRWVCFEKRLTQLEMMASLPEASSAR